MGITLVEAVEVRVAADVNSAGPFVSAALSDMQVGDLILAIICIKGDDDFVLTSNHNYTPGGIAGTTGSGGTTTTKHQSQQWYRIVTSSGESTTPSWTPTPALSPTTNQVVTSIQTLHFRNSNATTSFTYISDAESSVSGTGPLDTPDINLNGILGDGTDLFLTIAYWTNATASAPSYSTELIKSFIDTSTLTTLTEQFDVLNASPSIRFSSSWGVDSYNHASANVERRIFARATPSASTSNGACGFMVFLIPPTTVTLAGSQPEATGLLTRIFHGVRALTANQPSATATLTAHHNYLRTLAASQPFATGALTLKRLRSLAANQPTATAVLTRIAHPNRILAADQPAATASLSRILHALRALAADQPAATGTLTTRVITTSRILAADQPAATGVVTYIAHRVRSLVADQPAATTTLTRSKTSVRSLTANQLSPTATLVRHAQTTRSLTANQPSPTAGILGPSVFTLFNQVLRWIKGGRL